MSDNEFFAQSLDSATLKIIYETEQQMRKACLVVEKDAKKNCKVDQGILRASISHDVMSDSNSIVGSVYSNLDYAPYVEKGTGIYAKDGNGRMTPWRFEVKSGKYKGWHVTNGQKPSPFLEPARDINKSKIINILGGKTDA